jgi:hypothetical protein
MAMSKQFLVRTLGGKWDEVTEHVFNVKKFVVEPKTEKPLYGEQSVVVDGNSIQINGAINADELARLCRFLNVTIPQGAYGSFVNEPETVTIVKGNSTRLHVLKTGENWTKKSFKVIKMPSQTELAKAA